MVYPPLTPEGARLAPLIDHTLLKPEASSLQIAALCAEARQYAFASVCVNPRFIALALKELDGSTVRCCTVVGFPLGAVTSRTKACEAEECAGLGAAELDMVIAVGLLKDKDFRGVSRDIAGVVKAAGPGRIVKVILETHLLDREEKVTACRLAIDAGARFVKTTTGFTGGGATPDDVRLMRETVGAAHGVKASGGIRTREAAEAMIRAGASRIGTSSGVGIVTA